MSWTRPVQHPPSLPQLSRPSHTPSQVRALCQAGDHTGGQDPEKAAVAHCHKLGGGTQQKLGLSLSGGWKSKVKVLARGRPSLHLPAAMAAGHPQRASAYGCL